MSRSVFDSSFEDLPKLLPIFPLTGALVLPRGRLPLNIFEPRYLNMVQDVLGGDRMIGMVQPLSGDKVEASLNAPAPEIYLTGCAARITSFSETDDGRFLITLKGVVRFRIERELALRNGYRLVEPDYRRFESDFEEDKGANIDREALLDALTGYFESTGMQGDWSAIKEADDEPLVTWLSMGCPFGPGEKQALLEAETLAQRADTVLALLRMATHDRDSGPAHH